MVDQNPKRSGEPPVWLMFGAGGTVSAIFFPVVILILGLLLPFGLIDPHNLIIRLFLDRKISYLSFNHFPNVVWFTPYPSCDARS